MWVWVVGTHPMQHVMYLLYVPGLSSLFPRPRPRPPSPTFSAVHSTGDRCADPTKRPPPPPQKPNPSLVQWNFIPALLAPSISPVQRPAPHHHQSTATCFSSLHNHHPQPLSPTSQRQPQTHIPLPLDPARLAGDGDLDSMPVSSCSAHQASLTIRLRIWWLQ